MTVATTFSLPQKPISEMVPFLSLVSPIRITQDLPTLLLNDLFSCHSDNDQISEGGDQIYLGDDDGHSYEA